jgi:hypothetical protein
MTGDKDLDQLTAKTARLKFGMHLLTGYGKENEASARSLASDRFPVHILCSAADAAALLREMGVSLKEKSKERTCAS